MWTNGHDLPNMLRFDVFIAVKIHIAVFWIMTPCNLVGGYLHVGGKICTYLLDYVALFPFT
jgi:hypothetical protein